MLYLNSKTSLLQSREFLAASEAERGVWITLQLFCAMVENGGRIRRARDLTDRHWYQNALDPTLVRSEKSPLWSWLKQDLLVFGYPAEQEAACRKQRDGGYLRWKRPTSEATSEATLKVPPGSQTGTHKGKGNGKGKGKGKGKIVPVAANVCTAHTAEVDDPEKGVPTEAQVLKVAAEFAGDMARGIPPVIPEGWARGWFAYQLSRGMPFHRWPLVMVQRFKMEWVDGNARARGTLPKGEKNTPASVEFHQQIGLPPVSIESLREPVE